MHEEKLLETPLILDGGGAPRPGKLKYVENAIFVSKVIGSPVIDG
jgi:hypothetical protein